MRQVHPRFWRAAFAPRRASGGEELGCTPVRPHRRGTWSGSLRSRSLFLRSVPHGIPRFLGGGRSGRAALRRLGLRGRTGATTPSAPCSPAGGLPASTEASRSGGGGGGAPVSACAAREGPGGSPQLAGEVAGGSRVRPSGRGTGVALGRPGASPILGISGGAVPGGARSGLGRRQVEGVEVLDTFYVGRSGADVGATAIPDLGPGRSSTSLTLGGGHFRETLVLQDASGGPAGGTASRPHPFPWGRFRGSLGFLHGAVGSSFSRTGGGWNLPLPAGRPSVGEPGVAIAPGGSGLDRGFRRGHRAVASVQGAGRPGFADWVLGCGIPEGLGSGPGAGPFFLSTWGASGDAEAVLGLGVVGGGGGVLSSAGISGGGCDPAATPGRGSAELRFPLWR